MIYLFPLNTKKNLINVLSIFAIMEEISLIVRKYTRVEKTKLRVHQVSAFTIQNQGEENDFVLYTGYNICYQES